VRAVGCTHSAPPTHRTRRDGLDHGRSVPLPVALGGDDLRSFRLLRRPAAPTAFARRLGVILGDSALIGLNFTFAQRSVRRYATQMKKQPKNAQELRRIGAAEAFIDARMALGRVSFSLADLTKESGLSDIAAKYQLDGGAFR